MGLNCAHTSTGGTSTQAPRLTVQVLVPVQAPLQPANMYPGAATAVRITSPALKFAVHMLLPVQLMPSGADVTTPCPAGVTCSAKLDGRRRKVALKVLLLVIVVSHVMPSPGHTSTQSIQVMS